MPGDGGSAWGDPPVGDPQAVLLPDVGRPVAVDPAVIGCQGVVTVRIPGGDRPGEVRVRVRGTYELFIAYTEEALNVGHHVLVRTSRGGRAVDVTPAFTQP